MQKLCQALFDQFSDVEILRFSRWSFVDDQKTSSITRPQNLLYIRAFDTKSDISQPNFNINAEFKQLRQYNSRNDNKPYYFDQLSLDSWKLYEFDPIGWLGNIYLFS